MVIKNSKDVPYQDLSAMKGVKGVKKQILIGPEDGSNEIAIRLFSIEPGGNTPYHSHDFPHLVKVEKGEGIVIDFQGNEQQLSAGQLVYIRDNEVHGFKNKGDDSFDFLCIVPERGES